eukprot:TRINITY_DN3087_c0_g1_i4.p1 TRINITY_DN3087_c0_g1~~TRINITY_DN3087_c0_g1_i4.p1  ORF type:complete len:152 (-),score=50.52 TRINITY_DN3087_c0_g1_i4:109-564(-)
MCIRDSVLYMDEDLPQDMTAFSTILAEFTAAAKAIHEAELENARQLAHSRKLILSSLFQEVDFDDRGFVAIEELDQIGDMRQRMGFETGGWNEAQHARLVRQMDVHGDGKVEAREFVEYMNQGLPLDMQLFEDITKEYVEAVRSLNPDEQF